MQHTYHSYVPGSYQQFPSKVASIRADTAASSKEQDFHDYSRSYGSLGKLGVQQAHSKDGEQVREKSHDDDSGYRRFMPGSGAQEPQGPGNDYKKFLNGFDSQGAAEDYKSYETRYSKQGPSNKYVPDLDGLRDEERSDFIPSGSGQPATSRSCLARL